MFSWLRTVWYLSIQYNDSNCDATSEQRNNIHYVILLILFILQANILLETDDSIIKLAFSRKTQGSSRLNLNYAEGSIPLNEIGSQTSSVLLNLIIHMLLALYRRVRRRKIRTAIIPANREVSIISPRASRLLSYETISSFLLIFISRFILFKIP